ncbi:target of rapamycin complex subunit lst8-like isoform X2 [Artemia franciscana]|uniref:Target of rapamycin complex subunit lst8 n=1 Tax=Artemia franciscana TaxID=6661 RepID=A0AA88HVI6_ARTSF|nr:hypothetical protein QYM36_009084 [Artemia franciscana]
MMGHSQQVILATGGYDHTIKFWQAHSGFCKRTVQHPDSQVNALDITPDGTLVAAAGFQHIRMYEVESTSPTPVVNYEGVQKNVTAVGFHHEGHWMYTGGEDCTARIWDLRAASLHCQSIFQTSAPVTCAFLHPNETELIVGDQSGILHLWDLRSDHNEQLIPEADVSIQHIAVEPSGKLLAAINKRGQCFIWSIGASGNDVKTSTSGIASQLTPVKDLTAHSKYGLKCKFSPDGAYLATTSADHTTRLWSVANNFELAVELTTAAQRWVWDVVFSADSRYVITASSDGTSRLWSVEEKEMKKEYTGHQKAVTALAFKDGVPTPE